MQKRREGGEKQSPVKTRYKQWRPRQGREEDKAGHKFLCGRKKNKGKE